MLFTRVLNLRKNISSFDYVKRHLSVNTVPRIEKTHSLGILMAETIDNCLALSGSIFGNQNLLSLQNLRTPDDAFAVGR